MAKENPDFTYFKTRELSDFSEEEILYERDHGSSLSAFFVAHGYIESLLLDWLSYCGEGQREKISGDVQTFIERIGFAGFANLHLMMGNIDQKLYARLIKFNVDRNKLIHDIRNINLQDEKTIKSLNRYVGEGIKLYKEVFVLYKKLIEKIGKKVLEKKK